MQDMHICAYIFDIFFFVTSERRVLNIADQNHQLLGCGFCVVAGSPAGQSCLCLWNKAIQMCFFCGVVSLFHLRQADRRLTPPPPALCRVKAELSAALTRFRH